MSTDKKGAYNNTMEQQYHGVSLKQKLNINKHQSLQNPNVPNAPNVY